MSDRANFGKDSRKRKSDYEATQWRRDKAKQRDVARALANYGRSLSGRPAAVSGGAVAGLFVLGCLLTIGKLVLVGFMIYWNVTDIINVGPNFWNVFWLCMAAVLLFSGNRR